MAENKSADLDYDMMYAERENPNIKVDSFLIEYLITVLFTVEFTAILAVTVIFVYAYYRFKKLRTKPNFILLNFFVSVCVYTFCGLLGLYFSCFEIMTADRFVNHTLNELSTFFISAVLFFFVSSILFMALWGVDWFLSVNCPQFSLKHPNYHRWVVGVVYLICSVNVLLLILPKRFAILLLFLDIFLVLVSMLSVVTLACLYKFKSSGQEALNNSYRLSFSLCYIVFWCFITLSIEIIDFLPVNKVTLKMLLLLKYFYCSIILIAVLAPVALLVGLLRRDAHFNASVDYLCKKSRGIHEELDEEQFDETN